jgi:hypothetical protein
MLELFKVDDLIFLLVDVVEDGLETVLGLHISYFGAN